MKGAIYYVAIATVIFSHVKITCYFHVWRYQVFARKLTWYFIRVYIIKPIIALHCNNSDLISRRSMMVWVITVPNTIVADSDWHFDNLCSSHLQSQSELYHYQLMVLNSGYWPNKLLVNEVTMLLVISQLLSHDVIGYEGCHWCASIHLRTSATRSYDFVNHSY